MRPFSSRHRTLVVVLAAAALSACGGDSGESAAGVASSASMKDRVAMSSTAERGLPMPASLADNAESRALAVPAVASASAPPGNTGSTAPADTRAFALASRLGTVDATGAMLVRQGTASLEVKEVADAVGKARQAATRLGGFVADAAVRSGRDETPSATLQLRVPTAQFDGLVAALRDLGRVESVTATAQDVGDEYVDLRARAANARRLEARLVEMLATRTGKLSDVLTMEQELARVREEIERHEGRINFLERRASLSTLELSLHEPLPLIERQPGAGPLAEAFGQAWQRAVRVLAWRIASLGLLIPLALLVGGVVLLVRWTHRGGDEGLAG